MRGFARLLRLELTLQARSFIYPATVVSTAMICAFVVLLPVNPSHRGLRFSSSSWIPRPSVSASSAPWS
jgi:hypothetical protein